MKINFKNYTASLLLAVAAAAMLSACGGSASNVGNTNVDTVQNVITGSTVTLDGSSVTSADGAQTYNWTLESKPANSDATLNDPSVPTPTFTADKSGTYVAKLVTSSGAFARVTIMADFGNVAPVANAGVAQYVTTGTVITLDGSASSDANGDPLTYRWALISKPAGSLSALKNVASVAPTFSADMDGDYAVQLIVRDGTVNSKAATVFITATAGTNAVPVANAGAKQNVIAGALVTLDGSASSDANSDPLTYSWNWLYKPTGSTAVIKGADTAVPTFRADMTGTYVARLMVNDGAVNSAAAAVIINVTTGNAAPVADAGAAQNVLTGTVVTLNGSASSDANGDPLSYQWAWIYKPTGSLATLTGANTAAPTFNADLSGDYVARLIVNDGKVSSATAVVNITATAGTNAVPVASAGATQSGIALGATVTLNGSASSDANSDPLTYSWTLISKPAGSNAALTGKTTPTPTFTVNRVGVYVAQLVVNDGTVNSAPATVIINVGWSVGYVEQGSLVWMPVTFYDTWNNANAYCANFSVNSVTGWRMPTQPELSALYASGAMNGQGWTLDITWSSTQVNTGDHYGIDLRDGFVYWGNDTDIGPVSCVLDFTAPTTTAAPSVSGTTSTATTLSVTINKNGTGYYLVQPTTAPAPTVAEVQAGTAFAMYSNSVATASISGLTPSTAYTIFFVAKDAEGNVQAAVQSVPVTTLSAYVVHGGLTWMPIYFYDTWANADAYCTNTTINGVTGWRMPTEAELSALYTSGVMIGQGWTYPSTWSSTQYSAGRHYGVDLNGGLVSWYYDTGNLYVSCVR